MLTDTINKIEINTSRRKRDAFSTKVLNKVFFENYAFLHGQTANNHLSNNHYGKVFVETEQFTSPLLLSTQLNTHSCRSFFVIQRQNRENSFS